jgi:general secretion pathway protein D
MGCRRPANENACWLARLDLLRWGTGRDAARSNADGLCRCAIGTILLLLAAAALAGCQRSAVGHAESPSQPTRIVVSASKGWSAEPPRTVDLGGPTRPRLIEPQAYRGTGRLIAEAPGQTPFAMEGENNVNLNFVNADIGEVAAAILGSILKMNYSIDPAVKGTITVQTAGRPLPVSALMPTLEQILSLNGAALVKANGLVKVVPLEDVDRPRPALPTTQPSSRQPSRWRPSRRSQRSSGGRSLRRTTLGKGTGK